MGTYIILYQFKVFQYPLISSKRAVRSFGFFIAIDSTAPWKTKKFLAFAFIPSFSSSARYTGLLTAWNHKQEII